jgi:hypothetical protein
MPLPPSCFYQIVGLSIKIVCGNRVERDLHASSDFSLAAIRALTSSMLTPRPESSRVIAAEILVFSDAGSVSYTVPVLAAYECVLCASSGDIIMGARAAKPVLATGRLTAPRISAGISQVLTR